MEWEYNHKYYEKFAQLILNNQLNLNLKNLDKPDLQEINIGIEVTRAVRGINARVNKVFQYNYANDKRERNSEIKKQAVSLNVLEHLSFVNNNACTSVSYDFNQEKEVIMNSINDKNRKFKDYKKFKLNGLFIYTQVFESDIYEISMYIKEIIDENFNNFDIIYLYTNANILIKIEKNDIYITKKQISSIFVNDYKSMAKKYSKTEKVRWILTFLLIH